ncbi:MAG: replication-associated recombination protein A [Phycisphaerae bacterium]|nr:replication-associated recombination protein A [Phycisphaerae bacterium]
MATSSRDSASDLWSGERESRRRAALPLASRMRPTTLDEFAGQSHFLGPGKLLRRMLDADSLTSLLFAGPPGTGKTTLAEIVAARTQAYFERANAASIGVKEIRAIVDDARRRLEDGGRRTILFLDEIHRFSKAQQDVLLGDVESGVLTLIGATTENPYYAVNSALVSRSTVFTFEPLSETDIAAVVRRAVTHPSGLGHLPIVLKDEAIAHWARVSDGDARRALGALEVAAQSLAKSATGPLVIDLRVAEESIQAKALVYDGSGDQHYDLASAFIKSMRGSDPDAVTYWLARMLAAGEDPRFIARRIAIFASEDIGNADPQAAILAAATWQNVERIGMPEAQLNLAQAAIYMACAPKSGASSMAIWSAMDDVRDGRTVPVPMHLLDQTKRSMTKHAADGATVDPAALRYRNPHEESDGIGRQEYLGVDRTYYAPTTRGFEASIKERLERAKSIRRRGGNDERGAP